MFALRAGIIAAERKTVGFLTKTCNVSVNGVRSLRARDSCNETKQHDAHLNVGIGLQSSYTLPINTVHHRSQNESLWDRNYGRRLLQLPASIRHASSVSSFKSSLKTFLFSKTFASVPLLSGACACVCVCVCVCAQVPHTSHIVNKIMYLIVHITIWQNVQSRLIYIMQSQMQANLNQIYFC